MDLDRTLAALAADPDHPTDVAAVALHLAADEYPALDVPAYLAKLDDLADAVTPRLAGPLPARVAVFTQFLFAECGFRGNAGEYYDPRNSYLNEVIDRRLGLPITLSVLAAAVGRRCGLTVAGVGLPGHFIAKATEAGEEVLFDPFHGGRVLDRAGCEELVRGVTGRPFQATAGTFDPTPNGAIVARVLTNLKAVYLAAADYRRAARVVGRLVQLVPGDPDQRRDLGVCLLHAGRPGPAIDHLETYLGACPTAPDAPAVRGFLRAAKKEVARWN
jgi:regulator of sirC expression with transglutaminase-like and TPR domain